MIIEFLKYVFTDTFWWFGFFVGGLSFFILGLNWQYFSGLQEWVWVAIIFIITVTGVTIIS